MSDPTDAVTASTPPEEPAPGTPVRSRERVTRLPVPGLLRGMATTARTLARGSHTRSYPHEQPTLPERSRGVIALLEENCTSCMLCARECPDWCIYIDSHKETEPASTEGGRERTKNVLDRFAIDFSLCMYCGICIEVCPFDALFWAPDFAYATTDIRELVQEKDRLGEWMDTVPDSVLPQGYTRPEVGDGADDDGDDGGDADTADDADTPEDQGRAPARPEGGE